MALFRRSASRPLIGERAAAYIEQELPRRTAVVNHGGGVCGAQEVHEGTNSETWRVELERGPVIVRFWKVEAKRDKARECAHVLRVLHGLGLPTPQLIDADLSPETERRWGMRVTVEEFLPGRHLEREELAEPGIHRQVAAMLIRFHRETSDIAGRPWAPRNPWHPREPWVRARTATLLKRIGDAQPQHREACRAMGRVLAQRVPPDRELAPFSLIHGDLQPQNLLLDEEGTVRLIDFGTVMHAPFEVDLAAAEYNFEVPEAFGALLKEYFAASPPERAERFARHGDFHRALFALIRVSSLWRKADKPKHGAQRETLTERGADAWERLRAAVGRL